ncbi:hypothetical protein A3D05_01615 [Candidatus Gottesmanbacteria bacterium RIFCSPHIGHO2_02_FULL_40_24]|uniref:Major facilitator superfamily (MFS) profile domain-containing protein n=1 Tax=Candidatus Gottesmanbacteria bacterium RIFCSPHIGHO2_01_FULL_40_15 TaxID=1798376 RepID=A0A1F5YZ97_9BACT|nr:MAG: hypothetical protein A2777_04520 [Candidatus Gottesmanbacteria bacterium RIFCSPHIGHO2_01_FULL_40_15]OGG16364.1 MAG: hypothetical protein A3D05_01615 [Candidatus Gottesmanbacteria bacterium RIFCSPHIGHO2_02_FULL_40_24]OGG23436.1 MAG: hypothetical protein A3E42_00115 [Candidatus Gottesmanbacteria bacterium RIFCSPHIGHO2_12_FULL_40_13]OGG33034.1 MAG: hypothetical protein A3I80_03895 [Candidatus Gottesmanbacteria bacterium RIFCSPLOWO2_02_FULL_40_10]
MKFVKTAKFLIFLIVFINFLGYGIVFPILPLLTIQYGGNPLMSGILIGIFSLMQVIFLPVLGRLSDRFGRRPLLLLSLWGTVISFILMAATRSIFWLLIARIIDGASGGNLSIAQAYIADITDKKNRAGGMGIIAAGITLGFILGPLWGGFFSRYGLSVPFLAAAVITFISIILTQFFLKETITGKEIAYEKSHFSLNSFFKKATNPDLVILYFSNLLLFWAQSGVFTTLSLFGKDILNITVAQISLLFAFGGILSALIQGVIIGPTIKLTGEKRLFIFSTLIALFGMILLGLSNSTVILFAGLTVFAVGNGFLLPVIQAIVSEKSSPHQQGGNLGFMQSFGSIGRIFGPILAGFIYQSVNPYSPAVMGIIIFILVLILGLKLQ